MPYRRMGKTGLKLSALSFGSWVTFGSQVSEDTAEACLSEAYAAGVNFFDNAEGYANGQSEVVMGRLIRKLGWARDTFCVSSKVFFGAERKGPNQVGLSRKHVIEACEAALRRLQLDYLDLYFCHRPDPETPVEETVRAMNTLLEQGKVLYWGTSEWSAVQILEAIRIAERLGLQPPVVEQPQYHLLCRYKVEHEYAAVYESPSGLGTTIWSPLASGYLTGKYLDGIPAGTRLADPSMAWLREGFVGDKAADMARKTRALAGLAAELQVPLNRFAIAWCLANPRVSTVILGASRVEQLQDNLRALDVLPQLTPDVLARVDAIVQGPLK